MGMDARQNGISMMAADGEGSQMSRMRADARAIFEAAVRAVLPDVFLPPVLPLPKPDQNVVVFAAGKAAGSMAAAAEAFYLQAGLDRRRLSGLSIARHGYARPLICLDSREAGHPVPDQAGFDATAEMMARAKAVQPEDLVVFLLSGGASANLVAPAGQITLAEKQGFTRSLLKAGVPIDGINTIRKHISRIKGGRLAAMMPGAEIVTLALSDVPGDDISLIGSGPTIPDPSTLDDARAVIRRFGLEPPASIAAVLADPASESPKPGSPVFARSRALVAARPADAWHAAVQAAGALGYNVVSLGAELEGEAREVAAIHAERVLAERGSAPIAWLSGGELTVTIRGEGRGGPNQEYALALAEQLGGCRDVAALAADTDGTDGGVGQPDDPAGAFIDETTLARAAACGANAARHLANNDSTPFFRQIGDLFTPGPTFTNANDLRIILKQVSGGTT
jgi:hydroxypyruvate reductase